MEFKSTQALIDEFDSIQQAGGVQSETNWNSGGRNQSQSARGY